MTTQFCIAKDLWVCNFWDVKLSNVLPSAFPLSSIFASTLELYVKFQALLFFLGESDVWVESQGVSVQRNVSVSSIEWSCWMWLVWSFLLGITHWFLTELVNSHAVHHKANRSRTQTKLSELLPTNWVHDLELSIGEVDRDFGYSKSSFCMTWAAFRRWNRLYQSGTVVVSLLLLFISWISWNVTVCHDP